MSDRYRLTPLEVAAGVPYGTDPDAPPLPPPRPGETPLAALERALLPALDRPPCLVSFSGGRDSSLVLAVAARAARRHGLPPAIPATVRLPDVAETEESSWQERVVRHLRLDDWIRLEFDDQLDLLGPIAAGVLVHHGLLWPPNAHFHVPLLQAAAGGSLLTGIDGDMLFGGWRWVRPATVLAGAIRPAGRDVLRVGLALSPGFLRRAVTLRRGSSGFHWLRPNVLRSLQQAWAAESAAEPLRWEARVAWWARRRYLQIWLSTFRLLARDAGANVLHPLADPGFLAEVARSGKRSGWGGRGETMVALFSGVLPEEILTRTSKATFDGAFWNRHSRSFVADWQGEGVDSTLVDPDILRREWDSPQPSGPTATLLQSAWLATRIGR